MDSQKTTSENLEEYRQGVETLMKLKSSKPISNGLPSHAAILFEVFFRNANKKIRMFCKNLNKEVFGNDFVLRAAQAAIARGVELDILLQDATPETTEFSKWAQSAGNKVKLVNAGPGAKDSLVNFTVMDDFAVRYEENRDNCSALAKMYDPDLAKILARKFDELIAPRKSDELIAIGQPVGV